MYQLNIKRETRYGVPAADQILYNRHYVLGYSYYFRQAKWALELIDPDKTTIVRADNFRPDYRIPEVFRADLDVYKKSGYDRGHLVSSANQIETEIQNSETFLLSNMCPQAPEFNRQIWKELEHATRILDSDPKVLETYVITGPIFYFDQEVKMLIAPDGKGVSLPIPHAFFKSVLTENNRGTLHMWSFIIPNEKSKEESIAAFQVPTYKIEKYVGFYLWERLVGTKIKREKGRTRKIWKY